MRHQRRRHPARTGPGEFFTGDQSKEQIGGRAAQRLGVAQAQQAELSGFLVQRLRKAFSLVPVIGVRADLMRHPVAQRGPKLQMLGAEVVRGGRGAGQAQGGQAQGEQAHGGLTLVAARSGVLR